MHKINLDRLFQHGSYRLYPLVAAALSPSECAVITCIINGIRPHAIPAVLHRAKRTIKAQLKSISLKAGHIQADKVKLAVAFSGWSTWHAAIAVPIVQQERKAA